MKHLKSYSSIPWKAQEYSITAGIQGLAWSEQARSAPDWRRQRRWEMVRDDGSSATGDGGRAAVPDFDGAGSASWLGTILSTFLEKWSSAVWVVLYQQHHCYFYVCFRTFWTWNRNIVLLYSIWYCMLLLLLSHLSRVRLCVTQQTAARQAPPSLGFSWQEYWSGLPFPSPVHESEKWKWSRSVMSNPQQPHGLQPTRLLRPWDFPGRSTGAGCHCLCTVVYSIKYIKAQT